MNNIKSNKGVTLTILIIYIIAVVITVGILSTISTFFFSNTKYITDSGKYISEFNKFNMYFIEDVKNNSNIYSINANEIIFQNGTVYTFKSAPDNGIYRNKVKICKNVEKCTFTKYNGDNDKIIINVKISMKSNNLFQTDNDYVLKYW